MTIPAKAQTATPLPSTIEDVLMRGDLSRLTDQQRTEYMMRVCHSVGLNPLTRPFDYLTLNGKLQLYARRDAADQLRKLHGISIKILSEQFKDGLYTVHVQARNKDGRDDEDLGVVSFPANLKGEFAANTILKAVTKAKRRVTLSICGLGFLDETEVEDIPAKAKREQPLLAEDEPSYVPSQKMAQGTPDEHPEPYELSVPQLPNNAGRNWRAFGNDFLAILQACDSKADVFAWIEKNTDLLNKMREAVPKMRNELEKKIEEIRAEPS